MSAINLAVQSFCLRGFDDSAVVAQKVKECGLSAIELCGLHANFSDPEAFAGIVEIYRQAGVEIPSIGVQNLSGDEAKERKFFESAAKAGCKHMSVAFALGATPECFRVAEKLADEFDMHLGIHNHGGRHWLGNAQSLGWVLDQTSERVGLMLDTAWALDAREDPIAMMKTFAGRLTGLHIKDFVFDKTGKGEDVVVGEGNLDLEAMFATAREIGFDGLYVLEYEGDVENPIPALSKCVEAIRSAG
jgi:sugar phosphate isomerase/epimerase